MEARWAIHFSCRNKAGLHPLPRSRGQRRILLSRLPPVSITDQKPYYLSRQRLINAHLRRKFCRKHANNTKWFPLQSLSEHYLVIRICAHKLTLNAIAQKSIRLAKQCVSKAQKSALLAAKLCCHLREIFPGQYQISKDQKQPSPDGRLQAIWAETNSSLARVLFSPSGQARCCMDHHHMCTVKQLDFSRLFSFQRGLKVLPVSWWDNPLIHSSLLHSICHMTVEELDPS